MSLNATYSIKGGEEKFCRQLKLVIDHLWHPDNKPYGPSRGSETIWWFLLVKSRSPTEWVEGVWADYLTVLKNSKCDICTWKTERINGPIYLIPQFKNELGECMLYPLYVVLYCFAVK